jgi:HAMP domain-containing protein
MSIRTKLVGAFLLVATLVPVVGLMVSRVSTLDGSDGGDGGDSPAASVALSLAESQRAQQADLLTFLTGGDVQARERYIDESIKFQDSISPLSDALTGSESATDLQAITEERGRFGAAAEEMLNARASMDRSLTDIRRAEREIAQELNPIRDRFVGAGADLSGLPAAQRAQAAELLRGVEGMNQAINLQIALATAYTLQQQESARQQMDNAGTAFTNALRLANASAGADDRAALGRAEAAYTRALDPGTESLMNAADAAAQSRNTLAASSNDIVDRLTTLSQQVAGVTVESDSSGLSDTGTLTLIGTLLAFLLAGGLGLWFAGSITRPIRQLRNAAEQISTGDLDGVEINVKTKDEVGDLANAFRRMVTSIRFLMMDKAEREAEDRDFMSTSITM